MVVSTSCYPFKVFLKRIRGLLNKREFSFWNFSRGKFVELVISLVTGELFQVELVFICLLPSVYYVLFFFPMWLTLLFLPSVFSLFIPFRSEGC
jgi:hypothetical protein